MPTYQYQCTECGNGLEAVQKFSDDALTTCPDCQGKLRKVFSAVGVVFKGSGFYRTDSRSSSSSSVSSSSATPASTPSTSTAASSSSGSTSTSAPAAS
ncbi:FmdB family zinc ribbon protein [Kitasatospora sp. NPDC049285]|uniref:FmdB family zinc ribbon protein n=1 Tax=Kitasatospora sp. NPDC049285 TaxID=3157096 RepID=UPI003445949C